MYYEAERVKNEVREGRVGHGGGGGGGGMSMRVRGLVRFSSSAVRDLLVLFLD